MAGRDHRSHQSVARIRDQRRARVGHQRDRVAGADPLDQTWPGAGGIVLVVTGEARLDLMNRQQFGGSSSVFAGDHVGAAENLQAAQGHIGGIADRCRHNIERRRQFTWFGPIATLVGAPGRSS